MPTIREFCPPLPRSNGIAQGSKQNIHWLSLLQTILPKGATLNDLIMHQKTVPGDHFTGCNNGEGLNSMRVITVTAWSSVSSERQLGFEGVLNIKITPTGEFHDLTKLVTTKRSCYCTGKRPGLKLYVSFVTDGYGADRHLKNYKSSSAALHAGV